MPDSFDTDSRADRRLRREQRREWRRSSGAFSCAGNGSPRGKLFFSALLIVAGVLLFLDNIGVLRLANLWAYSPLFMVAGGVSLLSGRRSITRQYWGILLIVFGVLAVLLNTGVLRLHTRDDSWIIALMLIAFGFLALIKTIEGSGQSKPRPGFPQQPQMGSDNVLNEHTVAGSIKRRVETANFLGGQIDCVFGSVELDLRYAQIASEKPVTVDVNCVFGSTKMRVPDTWVVNIQAAGVFGNVEDKTIPPRAMNGGNLATLIITGQSVFSSLEVEN